MSRKLCAIAGLLLVATIVIAGYAMAANIGPAYAAPQSAPVGTLQILPTAQQTGISVSGQGSVEVTPDVATLRLGVEATADTVEEARSQAASAMQAVMDSLEESGVAPEDIQTQWLSINPVRHWTEEGKEILVGYRVSNMVTAKIRDVENSGAIVDAVTEAGGDLIRVQGITFDIDDPSPYHSQLRQEAMADARSKAEELAALAGVTVGKPLYISEGGGYTPVYRDVVPMAEAGAPTPISPGQLEISLSIQVVYTIE